MGIAFLVPSQTDAALMKIMKITETVTASPAIPEGRTLVATDNLGGALYPPSTARAGTEGIWRSLFSSKWTLFAVVLALGAVLLPVLRSIHNFLAVRDRK